MCLPAWMLESRRQHSRPTTSASAVACSPTSKPATALAADYERGKPGRSVTPSVVWMLGTWRAQTGALLRADSLHRVLQREAVHTRDPDAVRYAAALGARLALQRGDTTAIA